MPSVWANFIDGTLSASASNVDTVISAAVFANLPAIASPDTCFLVLDPLGQNGAPEIVTVTAHTASATSVTVTRGQGGTSARSHGSGTRVVLSTLAADLDSFIVKGNIASSSIAVFEGTSKILDIDLAPTLITGQALRLWHDATTYSYLAWNDVTGGSRFVEIEANDGSSHRGRIRAQSDTASGSALMETVSGTAAASVEATSQDAALAEISLIAYDTEGPHTSSSTLIEVNGYAGTVLVDAPDDITLDAAGQLILNAATSSIKVKRPGGGATLGNHIDFYGSTDTELGYVGYVGTDPNLRIRQLGAADLAIRNVGTTGDVLIDSENGAVRIQPDTGPVHIGKASSPTSQTVIEIEDNTDPNVLVRAKSALRDTDGRQFLRGDTSRNSVNIVQRGDKTATTDANGDIALDFTTEGGEDFTTAPTVVVSRQGAAGTAPLTCYVVGNPTTTGFTVRFFSGTTRQTATSVTFHWIAIGPKTDI